MKTKLLILIAFGWLAFTSCSKYPPASSRVAEDLAIYTQVDVNTDFNNYKTFSMPNTIVYIDGKDTSTLNNSNATVLLNRIALDMKNRGFEQIANTGKPDFGFNVTAIKTTTTTVYSPGWYYGYPGYYPWGYPSYGYPYYPTYISSYSAGTVIIDLVDLKNVVNNTIMVRWNAFIRGLVTNMHTQTEITNSVDQAFKQTPSLITTPVTK
ncbi:MAG: DUF4136 domain-containing protein [Bacteroidetes bacterium]|nr:DUF4136 domain-containing protein [Bacteroidota bacterium]